MLPINTLSKLTILLKLGSTEVTGLSDTDVTCSVVKADGSLSSLFMVGNFVELNPVSSPGLYLVTIPASVLNQSGNISFTFYNVTPGTFDSITLEQDVGLSQSDLIKIRKYLLNNEVVDQQNGLLNILDDNGVDIFLSYYLQDEQTKPSIYNIRRKILKT